MKQSDSAWGDPSPNRYRNATRACRLFHVFCIVTGPLGSIHSYRSIVCWRKHGFVGENYISPVTIHIILSKCEPIEPLLLRDVSFTAALLDRSSASVMLFLTVLGQSWKAVLRFSWTELRNEFFRASSTNRASSAWDDTHQNLVPARLLVSPVSRCRSIHLAVLSGTPCRLPASAAVRFPIFTRAITLSWTDWLWWGMLKEWIAL
jgi:hypothetical protein